MTNFPSPVVPDESPPPNPVFVSAAAAAHLLGLSRQRVYELCNDGQIESRRSGSRRLVLLTSVHEYANRLPSSA